MTTQLSKKDFLQFLGVISLILLYQSREVRCGSNLGVGFKCVECNPSACGAPPKNCPNGFVLDRCNCCNVCGKGEGTFCEGRVMEYGRCGKGLYCTKTSPFAVYGMCTNRPPPPTPAALQAPPAPDYKNVNIHKETDNETPTIQNEKKADKKPFKEPSSWKVGQDKADQKSSFKDEKKDVSNKNDKKSSSKYTDEEKSKAESIEKYKGGGEQKQLPEKHFEFDQPIMDDPSNWYSPSAPVNKNKCPPECTESFCSQNPRALCSARRQFQRDQRKCADECGTTACRACEVTFDPYKSCTVCPIKGVIGGKERKAIEHEKCVKEFARCAKKGTQSVRRSTSFQGQTWFNCAIPTC